MTSFTDEKKRGVREGSKYNVYVKLWFHVSFLLNSNEIRSLSVFPVLFSVSK